MPFRKTVLLLHRWVGLVTWAIVFIVSLSGAVYVFDVEIHNLLHRGLTRVEPSDRPMKPASEIIAAGRAALGPEAPASWIEGFGPERAVEVHAYRWDDSARPPLPAGRAHEQESSSRDGHSRPRGRIRPVRCGHGPAGQEARSARRRVPPGPGTRPAGHPIAMRRLPGSRRQGGFRRIPAPGRP